MKIRIPYLIRLFMIFGLLCHGMQVQAVTDNCNVTNVHYAVGNLVRIPCIEAEGALYSASFNILPGNIWELVQAAPVSTTISGVRSTYSNNSLEIPLIQLTDGSLWRGGIQATEQKSAAGNVLFKVNSGKQLTATQDLGKVIFQIGNKTNGVRANANANSNANKNNGNDNKQDNAKNGNKDNENNGNQSPKDITAAVLKVNHIELIGNKKVDLKVSGEVDLFKVMQGELQLLGEVVLPADTRISQMRLVLTDGSYVIADGTKYPLEIPSGEQTGLKINGDWGVTGGKITMVQLGFNADDIRFNKAQGYRVKPTVKVANVEMQALPVDSNGNTNLNEQGKPYILTAGETTLSIPNGAISNPETLWGQPENENTETPLMPIYHFGPEGTTFSSPVTVTLKYDANKIEDGFSEKDITILHNGFAIPSIVDTINKTVSAKVNHFSCFTYDTPVRGCNFADVTSQNAQDFWYKPLNTLCGNSVIKGVYDKIKNNTSFLPNEDATLFQTLKVFLSVISGCQRYTSKTGDEVATIISEAKDKLGSTGIDSIDNLFYNPKAAITRRIALGIAGKLLFGASNSNEVVIQKLIDLGVTSGKNLDNKLTRAELVTLGFNLIDSDLDGSIDLEEIQRGTDPNKSEYCEQFRSGKNLTFGDNDRGYETLCGTLLEKGIVKLSVSIITRSKWGARQNKNDTIDPIYSYFQKEDAKMGYNLGQFFEYIVIHHTADPLHQTVQELDIKEENLKAPGIPGWMPYHFIITMDGEIYEGRPLEFVGDHVEAKNTGKIGIVLTGDFESRIQNRYSPDEPTEAQLQSLEKLVVSLRQVFTRILVNNIKGHKDFKDTECPGANLYPKLDRIRKYADAAEH